MTAANKFDGYIRDFLGAHKTVSFEKIGTLNLEAGVTTEMGSLQGNFSFQYQRKAQTSEELIAYIAEQMQRNKTLIESDVYSFLEQARELMNTGKPWIIHGVGVFSINMSGEYTFEVMSFKQEESKPSRKERVSANAGQQRRTSGGGKAVQVITTFIIIGLIAGLAWVAYEYYLKDVIAHWGDNTSASDQQQAVVNDTTQRVSGDTAAGGVPVSVINAGDTASWAFVIENTFLLSRAQQRVAKLKSYGNDAQYDSVVNGTSKSYNIFIRKNAVIADTAAVRDSLAKFFQRPVLVHLLTK